MRASLPIFVLVLAGCDPGYRLTGDAVSATTHAPIAGAQATTVCPGSADGPRPGALSGSDGRFDGHGLGNFRQDCTLEVTAPGYAKSTFAVAAVCTHESRSAGCTEVELHAQLVPQAN